MHAVIADHETEVAGDLAITKPAPCLLYTSDAADERSSVDLGGRRIITKKNKSAILAEGTDDKIKTSTLTQRQ